MQGVASGSWPALAGAPTIGTATAGVLSASVAFTAPTYTGSGITGYTVTSTPGSITGTGSSSPITVSGLTAGTAYTFTVTATTAAGQGPSSAASNSVTPTAPYIEDVFSTYLYAGTGATQSIVNGVNLSANGGLVWIKSRNNGDNHNLFDTNRGTGYTLRSNLTNAQYNTGTETLNAFNATGFTLGSDASGYGVNRTSNTYVSWTFRKQPKFFDVVTWTGNGSASQTISHNLGSVPGCIIAKRISSAGGWYSYHSGIPTANNKTIQLNTTGAALDLGVATWNPTSTTFTADETQLAYNTVGSTYIAYIFASNAGGFGAAGTDNVITCGSFSTTDSATAVNVSLGYEPQWVLIKKYSASSAGFYDNWSIIDTMRGMAYTSSANLYANKADAEAVWSSYDSGLLTATGFTVIPSANPTVTINSSYIYIAIRRGPMATPTDATTVFSPQVYTGTSATRNLTTAGFPVDLVITDPRSGAFGIGYFDRLRGATNFLNSAGTSYEQVGSDSLTSFASMNGYTAEADTSTALINYTPNYVNWLFRRAPGFFDEVCYTGTSSATTVTHNLGVAPEMVIVKSRSNAYSWPTLVTAIGGNGFLFLDSTTSTNTASSYFNNTYPTSTVFSVGTNAQTNGSGSTFVAYLFATCAGVSKVGTYTGNGTTQTINCGFTGGARFVLIKRTDSTGSWYVYDTARGMTTSTDPYLLLNSSAAETATLGSVTTVTTGFALNATILAAINTSGASYIFLAIA